MNTVEIDTKALLLIADLLHNAELVPEEREDEMFLLLDVLRGETCDETELAAAQLARLLMSVC